MAFWHVGCGIKGGFIACSLYLVTGDGMGSLNQSLLFQIGAALKAFEKSYVIAADWQMEPYALSAGWLQAGGGTIRAPARPTCITWACASQIDYFVTGGALDQTALSADLLEKVDVKPHRAVCISLLAWNGMQKVKIMRRPKPIPAADPYGPFLPAPDWQDLQERAGDITTKEVLDLLTASFPGRFEEELV